MDAYDRTVDVVVIGSGMAGVCSAIQAARLGCSVALLEKDEVLGGNSSPNLGVHVSGAHSFHPYACETGIINEIEEEAARLNAKIFTHGYHYNIARQWDSLLMWMMDREGVDVRRRTYARDVVMDGTRIEAVIADDMATYTTIKIRVGVAVIDASGDGQIACSAGADFRVGREGASEFGERGAPGKADAITMGTSVTALVRKAGHPVDFVPPPGTPPFEVGYGYGRDEVSDDCLRAHAAWNPDHDLCFLYHTETGGEMDTIMDEHEIYERLIGQLYSVWNHIKNDAHPEESRNWELVWVSPKAGKRESRRFIGDYILTQNDVESGRIFEDEVAYGGYAVDVHDPVGRQAKVRFHSVPPLYSIPYRCIYSRNVENLLLGGRLISVSHMALGTVRLQRTLASGGQAAGAAAYLCKKHRCTPREVYVRHIEELKQLLLKNDATLLGTGNRDEMDMARRAEVRASSEQRFECIECEGMIPLDRARGIIFWDWPRSLDEISLYLRNGTGETITVPVDLQFFGVDRKWKSTDENVKPDHLQGHFNRMCWGGNTDFDRFSPLGSSESSIEPGREGWVRFEFDGLELPEKDPCLDEERLLLRVPELEGLSWGSRAVLMDIGVRCWASPDDGRYVTEPEMHLFKISPRPVYGEGLNVINGRSRRYSTNPVNMWMSRIGEMLPQELVLEFGEPVAIDEVHLTFDTLHRAYRDMPFNSPERRASGMCVSDYRLDSFSDGRWWGIENVRDNYRRFRVHKFEERVVSKLRLSVLATAENGWEARVYQVRAYGPPRQEGT